MTMEECTKEDGWMILEKVMAMRSTTIKISISGTLRREKLMEKDFTHGRMENTTKESGRSGRSMGLESGREMEESLTLETGSKEKLMGWAHMSGRTETCMKEAGSTV
jgi:hypothetical protein